MGEARTNAMAFWGKTLMFLDMEGHAIVDL
jgi:hypothetical protein